MHPCCRTWTSRQAYYNSSQHSLRSVYENRLEENGYILAMADNSTIIRLDIIKYDPIGIEKMLVLPQIYYIIVAELE